MSFYPCKKNLVPAIGLALLLQPGWLQAAAGDRFLKPDAWQCTINATMKQDTEEAAGPGGMAHDPKRQLFEALKNTGMQVENPGGNTDTYRQKVEHVIDGKIRLHHRYDGGIDGIQIAGWGNGGADVRISSWFEGTEQGGKFIRDKTASFEGFTPFEGEEYEPSFQIWIYPDQGIYTLDYFLGPVTAKQVEHCRMREDMEAERRKMESATDADAPLGGLLSGLTKVTCPTERITNVSLEGGALSGMIESRPLPRSGLVLEGEGESDFIGSAAVMLRWSCRPE